MKEIYKQECYMVLGNFSGKMMLTMKEILNLIKLKEKENTDGQITPGM